MHVALFCLIFNCEKNTILTASEIYGPAVIGVFDLMHCGGLGGICSVPVSAKSFSGLLSMLIENCCNTYCKKVETSTAVLNTKSFAVLFAV